MQFYCKKSLSVMYYILIYGSPSENLLKREYLLYYLHKKKVTQYMTLCIHIICILMCFEDLETNLAIWVEDFVPFLVLLYGYESKWWWRALAKSCLMVVNLMVPATRAPYCPCAHAFPLRAYTEACCRFSKAGRRGACQVCSIPGKIHNGAKNQK